MKIAYISVGNPHNRYTWSGTFYKMFESLKQQNHSVEWIPVCNNGLGKFEEFLIKCFGKLIHKPVMPLFFKCVAKQYAKSISVEKLNTYDLIYAPCCGPYLYHLKGIKKPIVYMSDASPEALFDYYIFDTLKYNRDQANSMEKKALDKCSALIYGSDWAKGFAVNFYNQDEHKVHVLELGANLDDKDIIKKDYSYNGHLHLLFLGVDWKRKGGDIAVSACKYLNDNGVPATLHIVGIRELSEDIKSLPYVDYVGFLDKNNPVQYQKLVDMIKLCHCLLLPTIAECAGVVFGETSAYGLPSFTHHTGGTTNYVLNGRNGYGLPLGSTGEDFGKIIKKCLETGELEKMSKTCIDFYNERLNWSVWGQKMDKIIKDVVKQNKI